MTILMLQVYEEKERIQVVMPATKIPNWFYLGGRKGIPLFWARNNFPVIALAFELGEVKENDKINKDTLTSKVLPGMVSSKSHVVGLHLFNDGKEIYHKDYGYCSVGEHHMLVCDLRTLFNDEEWKGLNACFGRNWKTVQVQCESQLIINRWGLYVYKQKTNHTGDNISFDIPHGDNVGIPVLASGLVPKVIPRMLEQRTRHVLENMNPREVFGDYFPLIELDETPNFTKSLLRSWMLAKANIKGESPAFAAYGASLKQEHEDCGWDVVRVVQLVQENIPILIADSYTDGIQSAQQIFERVLREREKFLKKQDLIRRLDIHLPIILEACHSGEALSHRYWGRLMIEHGDPKFNAVLLKTSELSWKFWDSSETSRDKMNIILLKCQVPLSTIEEFGSTSESNYEEDEEEEEEEEDVDTDLDVLLSTVEKDVMMFNKSYGMLQASIVLTEDLVSDKYLMETLSLRGLENSGRIGSNFNRIPNGTLRVEDIDDTQQKDESTVNHGVEQAVQNQNQNQNQMMLELTNAPNKSSRKKVVMRWILCCFT
jgi:hypothetical protein